MFAANGRLACIKSTLYGNVELLQRRLLVYIMNVGWSTLVKILPSFSLTSLIFDV